MFYQCFLVMFFSIILHWVPLDASVEYVKDLVTQRNTHSEVSLRLKEVYTGRRGLSLRSVRRFCFKNGIHTQNRLSYDELERYTKEVVAWVGMLELFVFFSYIFPWGFKIDCNSLDMKNIHVKGSLRPGHYKIMSYEIVN